MADFTDATSSANVIETVENYAVSDQPFDRPLDGPTEQQDREIFVYDDEEFWHEMFSDEERRENSGNHQLKIYECFVSSWVARVPGLFWKPESKRMRAVKPKHIESIADGQHSSDESERWVTYDPPGKTQKVSGGIGTLRFPPDQHGRRLVTLSCSMNASAGIPALITDDVWQQLGGSADAEGRQLKNVSGRWQELGMEWSPRFRAVKGIPRGYLVINEIFQAEILDEHGPVQFHPFSVMEYESENSRLFDFVYATADLGETNWRRQIEHFFERYKSESDRNGRYLTSADIAVPLWDADYMSPTELRRSSSIGRSQLDLLEERVRLRLNGEDLIAATMTELGKTCAEKHDLQRLSKDIGVPTSQWSIDGSFADAISAFMAAVVSRTGKLEELIHFIATHTSSQE